MLLHGHGKHLTPLQSILLFKDSGVLTPVSDLSTLSGSGSDRVSRPSLGIFFTPQTKYLKERDYMMR
jgi:hypothetical protein